MDTTAILRRAKVPAGDGVTLAGLLTVGRYPQKFYPQLVVTFVHYPTIAGADSGTGERFIDNVVAEGPIPAMVADTVAAVRRNMVRRSVVRGAGRSDTTEYPEEAVREAVANALAHRDYSAESRGTQVQVEMYPDRLLVRNPGGLYGPVSAERLGQDGVSSARNATLLRLLEDAPIPGTDRTVGENRGSGIRTMLAALRVAGMSPPTFTDRIATFTVTFRSERSAVTRHGEPTGTADPHSRDPVEAGGPGRADRRAAILAALGDQERARAEVADATGLSHGVLARWLALLRADGLVEMIGPSRSPKTRYRRVRRPRRGRSGVRGP